MSSEAGEELSGGLRLRMMDSKGNVVGLGLPALRGMSGFQG